MRRTVEILYMIVFYCLQQLFVIHYLCEDLLLFYWLLCVCSFFNLVNLWLFCKNVYYEEGRG